MEYRTDLIERSRRSWESAWRFRADRLRNKRFTYGDQWSDTVSIGNRTVREDDYLREQGRLPLKNNLIRRLVRNVLGVFRDRYKAPTCRARDAAENGRAVTMQKLLRCNAEVNRLAEMYARTMEEFLISGLAVHKKWYGRKGNRTDCWTDFVQPDNFFVDGNGRDFRGWDVSLVGEIHDMGFEELMSTFASDALEAGRLESLYGVSGDEWGDELWSGGREGAAGFLVPAVAGRCRVIEVWTREYCRRYRCHDRATGRCFKVDAADICGVEAENRRRRAEGRPPIDKRWFVDEEWRWYFLTPAGGVLRTGVSPYRHGSHPYVFKAYPFIDGEVHSFVSDVIDQQKVTNRLISMYDWILQASAKGVLLLPEGALPEDTSLDDIADEWSRFDGVIVFRPQAGQPVPQQISSKAADIGITELLNIQMKMMEDISGVNGALQGKLDSGSMSGTLYSQQTRNSLSALADLMLSFDDFIREATAKDAVNIGQYYDAHRIARIAGDTAPLVADARFDSSQYDFGIN